MVPGEEFKDYITNGVRGGHVMKANPRELL